MGANRRHRAISRHIAAVENGVPEDAVTSTQHKRVYVSLYQAHLPKLDAFGAIAFDRDRGTVERTPRTDDLLDHLDRVHQGTSDTRFDGASSPPVGATLLAVALVAVFVGELGVLPSDVALGVAVLLSVCGVGAVAHVVRR